jgi:hypothetical protein
MSMLSMFPMDQSELLCKRFATLASSYIDQRDVALAPAARVPLENLFRLLEMLRYGAFADEHRKGVLAIERIEDRRPPFHSEATWHARIEDAMKSSIAEAFDAAPLEGALDRLENTLRWLANAGDQPDEPTIAQSRAFFARLAAKLP